MNSQRSYSRGSVVRIGLLIAALAIVALLYVRLVHDRNQGNSSGSHSGNTREEAGTSAPALKSATPAAPDVVGGDVTTPSVGDSIPFKCRVVGRVLSDDDSGLSDTIVRATDRKGLLLGKFSVGTDGAFRGELPLPARDIRSHWIGRLQIGDQWWSTMCVSKHLRHGETLGVSLYLQSACMVAARAVDQHGNPVSGASFTIAERPTHRKGLLPTWEPDSIDPCVQTVECDAEGRVVLPVRQGSVHLRAMSPAGVFGSSSVHEVEVGKFVDAGDHVVGEFASRIHGRVLDARSSKGVTNAWIQFTGDLIRADAQTEIEPTLECEQDGSFVITKLGEPSLPIRVAVGSPIHQPSELELSSQQVEYEIKLERRPVIRIRVVAPDNLSQVLSKALHQAAWTVRFKGRPAPASSHVASAISQVTAVLAHGNPRVYPATSSNEFIAYVPRLGKYDVALALPGGIRCETSVRASHAEASLAKILVPQFKEIDVSTSTTQSPTSLEEFTSGTWGLISRSDRGRVLASWNIANVESVVDGSIQVLVPSQASQLQLVPWDRGVSSFEASTSQLTSASQQTVCFLLRQGLQPKETWLQLTHEEESVPLGDATIWVIRQDSETARSTGSHFLTDGSGTASVWLPPGVYRAVSLRRFGPPHWISFRVDSTAKDPVTVSLPVDR